MATEDTVWYYARGESEQGPLSTAQIQSLAAAGALRRDDLVWKEGMEDWVPAREITELFPKEAARKDEPKPERSKGPTAPRTSRPPSAVESTAEVDWLQVIRSVGRALVVLGVLVVLMSRGCDSLGVRKVARLKAMSAASPSDTQLHSAATDTEAENQMWGYWRHLGFLFGTMALALGLLAVTPTTEGPERWICLIMLTVVVYSVYAANSVWDGSF